MDRVYTVNIGAYDEPRTDIECITENYSIFEDKYSSRWQKINRYKGYPDVRRILYMDANIYPLLPTDVLLDKYLGNYDIALIQHPFRGCAYDEIDELMKFPDNDKEVLQRQKDEYRKNNFPENFGLWECGVIFRRNTALTNALMEWWWNDLLKYTHRDQPSFAYVLWKFMGIYPYFKFRTIENGNVRENKDFKYIKHL